jgi:beta-RFAP synthase
MRGDLGRIHGSVGVSIKKPRLILDIEKSSETTIKGARSNRASEICNLMMESYDIHSGVDITIYEDIPEHSGFGSGTQLALAIGCALNRIFNLELSIEDIAIRLERSRVSGIGTHGFLKGGFIIDGGHPIKNSALVPPLIYRQNFPDDWKFVVCIPELTKGYNGEQEQNAFKKLEPPPGETVAAVSRVVLMQMIPAIIEKDIILFGDAMTCLDSMFGDYWEKIQGGTYSHPRIEECVNHLLDIGAYGAGQSSWGPALYGLADGENHAKKLLNGMNKFLNEGNNSGYAFITSADNIGAKIIER